MEACLLSSLIGSALAAKAIDLVTFMLLFEDITLLAAVRSIFIR